MARAVARAIAAGLVACAGGRSECGSGAARVQEGRVGTELIRRGSGVGR